MASPPKQTWPPWTTRYPEMRWGHRVRLAADASAVGWGAAALVVVAGVVVARVAEVAPGRRRRRAEVAQQPGDQPLPWH